MQFGFTVVRCSDEGGQLKVTEVGEKPLKREMLDTTVSLYNVQNIFICVKHEMLSELPLF